MQKTPWAILLCKFSDNDTEPFNFQFYENLFTQTGAGMQNMVAYFHDVSLGNVDLSGSQVFGWFTLNKKRSDYQGSGTNPQGRRDLINWAKQAATDGKGTLTGNADLSKFFGIVVCMNVPTDLFGGGDGVVCAPSDMTPYLLGQEMGHRYGLGHSRADGSQINYQDPWDIMSTGANPFSTYSAPHPIYRFIGPSLNAWNMRSLGWLDESRVWKEQKGFVDLRPLIRPDLQGFLAAQVGDFLVEFRVKEGWDARIPEPAILIHRFNEAAEDNDGWPHSYIMDGVNGQNYLTAKDKFQVGSETDVFDSFISVEVISIDPETRVARLAIGYREPYHSPILEGSILFGLKGGGDGLIILGGKIVHVSPGTPNMRILEQIALLETSQLVRQPDLRTTLQREALTTITSSAEKELVKLDSFNEPAPLQQRQVQLESEQD